jgi:small multidrug resistance pump
MSWIYLACAIVMEVIGTTNMKLSQGFTKTLPSILVFVSYVYVVSGSGAIKPGE